MDLNFNCLVFILFAFNRYIEGQHVYVSDQNTTWGQGDCTLAVLNLTFMDNGSLVGSDDYSLTSLPDDGVWIGLYQASLSYAYVGCNIMDGNIGVRVGTISECRWKTSCNTFAVRKITNSSDMLCKCFESASETSSKDCKLVCFESGVSYQCGRDDKDFSIYTVEDALPSSANYNDLDKNCLGIVYENGSENFVWWPCERENPVQSLCVNKPFKETGWTTIGIKETYLTWHDAAKKCFDEPNGYPLTIKHLANTSVTWSYWTGVVRTNSLLRNSENLTTYNTTRHAYVTLNEDDVLELKFDKNSLAERFSLCANVSGIYVSEQNTTWEQGNCTLAVLNVTFTDNGLFVASNEYSLTKLPDEGAWIGLYQAPLSYAYVGCEKMNESNVVHVRTIGECRWRTGCDIFAVRKRKESLGMQCKCFGSASVTSSNHCHSVCTESEVSYKCGRADKNYYFSIFTVENALPSSVNKNDLDKRCLRIVYESGTRQFEWWKCDAEDEVPVLCVDRPFTEMGWTTIDIDRTYSYWHEAVQECFDENDGYPLTIKHLANTSVSQSYWTGVIRTYSLLRNSEESLLPYNPKLYAYVTWNQGKLEVRFDNSSSAKRLSLCANETSTTTTLTSTTVLPTTTMHQSTATAVEQGSSTIETVTTSNSQSVTASTSTRIEQSTKIIATTNEQNVTPVLEQQQQYGHDVEIVAGVSACVVFVVVIVILCFLKRRGMLRCFSDLSDTNKSDETALQESAAVYTEQDTSVKPKAYPNHAYSMQERFLPLTSTGLDPVNGRNMHKPLQESKQSDHVYNTADQHIEDYDDINPADVLPMNDNDLTTNCRTGSGTSEETYNHLNEEMLLVQTADNTYGLSGGNVPDNKNEMVVGNPTVKNPLQTTDSLDGGNVHISHPQGNRNGDNVYNTVNQQAEQYDHINPADIKHQVDNYDLAPLQKNAMTSENKEETYNHLNEPLCRMPIAENVYGLNEGQQHENDYDTTPETFLSGAGKVCGQDYDKINRIW